MERGQRHQRAEQDGEGGGLDVSPNIYYLCSPQRVAIPGRSLGPYNPVIDTSKLM